MPVPRLGKQEQAQSASLHPPATRASFFSLSLIVVVRLSASAVGPLGGQGMLGRWEGLHYRGTGHDMPGKEDTAP